MGLVTRGAAAVAPGALAVAPGAGLRGHPVTAPGALSGAHLGAVTLQGMEPSGRRALEMQLSLPSRQRRKSSPEFPRFPRLLQPYEDGSFKLPPLPCHDTPRNSLQVPTVLGTLCVQESRERFPRFSHTP